MSYLDNFKYEDLTELDKAFLAEYRKFKKDSIYYVSQIFYKAEEILEIISRLNSLEGEEGAGYNNLIIYAETEPNSNMYDLKSAWIGPMPSLIVENKIDWYRLGFSKGIALGLFEIMYSNESIYKIGLTRVSEDDENDATYYSLTLIQLLALMSLISEEPELSSGELMRLHSEFVNYIL